MDGWTGVVGEMRTGGWVGKGGKGGKGRVGRGGREGWGGGGGGGSSVKAMLDLEHGHGYRPCSWMVLSAAWSGVQSHGPRLIS